MRVLWVGILLLVIVTVVVVLGGREGGASMTASVQTPPIMPQAIVETVPGPELEPATEPEPVEVDVVATPEPEPEPEVIEIAAIAEPEPEPEVIEIAAIAEPAPEPEPETAVVVTEPAPEPEPETAVVVTEPAPEPAPETESPAAAPVVPLAGESLDDAQALIADLIESVEAREAEAQAEAQTPTETSTEIAAETPTEAGGTAPASDAAPAPVEVTIEAQEDGSQLVDGKYILKGSGTRDDPYRVGWDYLISVSRTYDPRGEKFDIAPHIQMLHDKWVRVTGYLAFPLAGREVEEGLMMLNQWDGCCIGVPPSPYDGIEFRLEETITLTRRHYVPFGTATGVLKVDPYLVNGFLVGLYLMEQTGVDMGF